MKRTKIIIVILLAVLFTVSVIRSYSYEMFFVDVLIMLTFKIISFGCVGCIVYYFVKDVCLQKKCKKQYSKNI